MAQQVAVVQRAQAEVVEVEVERGIQRVVELARVDLHEVEQALVDQADLVAARDRLREGADFLAGHLLGDEVGQQARGQAAVYSGSSPISRRGGADGQFVHSSGAGAVVQAGNGAGGHAHRIDRVQTRSSALHRARSCSGRPLRDCRCAWSRSWPWPSAAESAEIRRQPASAQRVGLGRIHRSSPSVDVDGARHAALPGVAGGTRAGRPPRRSGPTGGLDARADGRRRSGRDRRTGGARASSTGPARAAATGTAQRASRGRRRPCGLRAGSELLGVTDAGREVRQLPGQVAVSFPLPLRGSAGMALRRHRLSTPQVLQWC